MPNLGVKLLDPPHRHRSDARFCPPYCLPSIIWQAGHAWAQGMGCTRPHHWIQQSPTCRSKWSMHTLISISVMYIYKIKQFRLSLYLFDQCWWRCSYRRRRQRASEVILLDAGIHTDTGEDLEHARRGGAMMEWHQPCVVLVHKDKRKEIYGESGMSERTCRRWPGGGWGPASRAWPARSRGTRARRSQMAGTCSAAAPPATCATSFHKPPEKNEAHQQHIHLCQKEQL